MWAQNLYTAVMSSRRIMLWLIGIELAGVLFTVPTRFHDLGDGGLVSGGIFFLLICTLIAWGFIALAEKAARKNLSTKPPKIITPASIHRYKVKRTMVIIALLAYLIGSIYFGTR